MKKGSHNSLSYGRCQWWLRPLSWTARCQCKNWMEQLDAGVRYFDLRVRRVNGRWVAAHGLATYEGVDVEKVLNGMDRCVRCKGWECFVAVMLENTFFKADEQTERAFVEWYDAMEKRCRSLIFCGAFRKAPVYALLSDPDRHRVVSVLQHIYHRNPESFDDTLFGMRCGGWIRHVKSLIVWPWYWAYRRRRTGEELLRRRDDDRYLFMDFV